MANQPIDKANEETTTRGKLPGMGYLLAAVKEIEILAQDLEGKYQRLKRRERALKKLGVIHARVTLKQGKYVYVVHRGDNEEPSTKQYIGNDEKAVADAFASIERGKELVNIQSNIEDIKKRIRQSQLQLRKVMQTIRL